VSAPAICVLGSINVDYVIEVPELPRPGQTCVGSGFRVVLGGKGANQAVACGRLAGAAHFIACAGDDAMGEQAVAALAQAGVRPEGVMREARCRTGTALIFVDAAGENCIGIAAEANGRLDPERVGRHRQLIAEAQFLLMQLETPLPALQAAIAIARAHGTRVVLNPAPAAAPLPDELLAGVDLLTPNETELLALTGTRDASAAGIASAARTLHERHGLELVVTLGADGALWLRDGCLERIPAVAVEAVDTVGAGDTYNGALVTALAEGRAMDEALNFAARAAALSVTRPGAQDAVPSRAEVDGWSGGG